MRLDVELVSGGRIRCVILVIIVELMTSLEFIRLLFVIGRVRMASIRILAIISVCCVMPIVKLVKSMRLIVLLVDSLQLELEYFSTKIDV